MEAVGRSSSGMAEQYMHKNRLQEHAQKAAIPLPIYQTVNEGSPHAPQFRSTVIIDGATFRSSLTFNQRKAAEQDVARLALEGISQKIKHEGIPVIHNDTVFCKSILYEYAVKMNLDRPTYTTFQSEGLLPSFISSVVFAGETYRGYPGRNRKEAEQLGARAVIESILGSSNSRTLMSQIVKSKGRLYIAINKDSGMSLIQDQNVALEGHVGNHSTSSFVKGKELQASVTNDNLPVIASSGQLANSAAVHSFCSVKREYICIPSSASTGNGRSIPVIPQVDPLAGSASKPLNTGESDLAHCNQVMEIPLVVQHALPSDSQRMLPRCMLPSNCRKRPYKNKGERSSKNTRTN